jgi:3-hydroxyisobutyrate dehydrogenase-like beta-hydroxyacid dehydrogenase
MKARFSVVGYDIDVARRRRHVRAGGIAARSAADAGAPGITICSLPSSEALLDVAGELSASAQPPRLVIETSTLPIAVKEEARVRLAAARATLLDCPISGTGAQARAKDVVVYASGPRALVGQGAGSSRILQVRGPMMVRGRYGEATASLSVFAKDLKVIGDFARQVGCPTPLFAAAGPVYAAAMASGRGAQDTAAVCAVLEAMANYHRKGSRRTHRLRS